MTITANDHYRHPARITKARFGDLLRTRANPAVCQERDPDEYYDTIVEYGIDPLFVLAMFNHESSMGKAGVAVTSKSWGNTRAPNFGAVPVGDMPGRTGRFPIWATWLDGCKSTCARLVTADWYYGYEQRNIGQVFNDPHYPERDPGRPARAPVPRTMPMEWAPAGDLNSPTGYLRAMLDFMNAHQDIGEEDPVTDYPKPPMIHYPSPNRDGYSTPRDIQLIVNHIGTGTKASNLSWLTNPASGASCNAYIDKQGTIYELVPPISSPWTNGQVNQPDMSNPIIAAIVRDGVNPNTRSYTIEHEGNPGDDLTPEQIAANNQVTAWVASTVGLPINRETIVGHYQFDSVNRPYCPSFTDDEWRQLVNGALQLLDPTLPPIEVPTRCFPDVSGIDSCIVWGFKGYWERLEALGLAYQEYGYPQTDEFRADVDGTERTVQLFERGGLAWFPESAGTAWEYRRLTRDELREVEDQAKAKGLL